MIMNMIDFDMDVLQAISAPRISFVEPDRMAVERGVGERVIAELKALGHKIEPVGGIGLAHALTVEYDVAGKPERFTGAADPRGEGLAKGF
jgi:gamma-glutamyltranspeptidase/glutathione hydrolase